MNLPGEASQLKPNRTSKLAVIATSIALGRMRIRQAHPQWFKRGAEKNGGIRAKALPKNVWNVMNLGPVRTKMPRRPKIAGIAAPINRNCFPVVSVVSICGGMSEAGVIDAASTRISSESVCPIHVAPRLLGNTRRRRGIETEKLHGKRNTRLKICDFLFAVVGSEFCKQQPQ